MEKALQFKRFRRLRNNPVIRDMVRETHLSPKDLIYPLFARSGENVKKPVGSMPGVYQMSPDVIVETCKEIRDLGIPAVILFGIPEKKDEIGSDAHSETGIIQKTIAAIKENVEDLLVIGDVCMCEYTSHGHCGIVSGDQIVNDETLVYLSKIALTQAKAGVDIIAPSDMMDGRVAAIRQTLDNNKYKHLPIMSYAAKFASSFYGPFREAAEGAPKFGDRKSHQMDYANGDEALKEIEEDLKEGADIVMVKPAMPYLDIIKKAKETFKVPTAAYQVSGEYAMLKAAAEKGWLEEEKVAVESLTSIKRAGADMILTYFAVDVAKMLNG